MFAADVSSVRRVLDAMDAAAVRRWSRTAIALLEASRVEIDASNVFPVADNDTGTNMLVTLRAADDAIRRSDDTGGTGGTRDSDSKHRAGGAGATLAAMSHGAALGATGNSGFILSQLLRGLAEAVASAGRWDAAAFARGLDAGARLGRQAVVAPVDGTVLTVARAAADAALDSAAQGLAVTVDVAVRAAGKALADTTGQLADLAVAGVVDAGGRGLLILLQALAAVVNQAAVDQAAVDEAVVDEAVVDEAVVDEAVVPEAVSGYDHARTAGASQAHVPAAQHAGAGFEVQYLLDADAAALALLRGVLTTVGDSVALVPAGGVGTWKVHVHTHDIGAAVEAGLDAGRPHHITVQSLAAGPDPAPARESTPPPDRRRPVLPAVLAVAPGAGLAHLFESEGVGVVDGASVEGVLAAIRQTRARELVLLPNASQVTGVAEQAAEQARAQGVRVSVVPTRSPVQGLAAIAVHDPARRFDDDVVAMAEAAAATRFAEVSVAQTRALTAVGICQPGDVLGLIDGEVVDIGGGLLAVCFGLVDRLLGVGAELVTILVGLDAPTRAGEQVAAHVRRRSAFTDVTVYPGGQRDHPVIIGAE